MIVKRKELRIKNMGDFWAFIPEMAELFRSLQKKIPSVLDDFKKVFDTVPLLFDTENQPCRGAYTLSDAERLLKEADRIITNSVLPSEVRNRLREALYAAWEKRDDLALARLENAVDGLWKEEKKHSIEERIKEYLSEYELANLSDDDWSRLEDDWSRLEDDWSRLEDAKSNWHEIDDIIKIVSAFVESLRQLQYAILGTYDPVEKEITLYMKNIRAAGAPLQTVLSHELFHAVHFYLLERRGADLSRRTEPIAEIAIESLASYFEYTVAQAIGAQQAADDLAQSWQRCSLRGYPYGGAQYIRSFHDHFAEILQASLTALIRPPPCFCQKK